jgi:all-beta uncharacterized protein
MDIGAYNFSGFPKLMYHPTELPKTINYPADQEKLEAEGWSATYIVQEWPKCYFGPDGATKNVANPEEAAALGPGWSDTPPDTPDVPPVTLNPASTPVAVSGGSGSFTVTVTGAGESNSWTVDKDAVAAWLTVDSPPLHTPQTANGTVNFTAAENTGAVRTAKIYVNGKTHTVDQAGTPARRRQ